MDPLLLWIIAGFGLVIVELLTGTFYLLVIGVASFAGDAAAWGGGSFLTQAICASAVALAGTAWVRRWHAAREDDAGTSNLLDLGQPVVLEAWTDEATGRARVKYRGASWDARVAGGGAAPGGTLYITGQDGSTLLVGASPAPN